MSARRLVLAGVTLLLVVIAAPATAHAAFIVPGPTAPLPTPTAPASPQGSVVPPAASPPATPCAAPAPTVAVPPAPGAPPSGASSCPYFTIPGIGGVVGAVGGPVVGVLLSTMVQWVSDGAASLLSALGGFLNQVTAPDIGSSWFQAHYVVMAEIAMLLVLPLLLGAVFTAIVRQDGGVLVRSIALHLPLAAVGTFLATQLIGLALGATDELCTIVLNNDAGGASHFLAGMGTQVSGLSTQSGVSGFAVVVVAVVLIVGALAVLLELLMRTAAVYVAVLFLPIVLAGLVWPATLRWARRLVELLAVLILSKFVIVAVLSLAASALAAGVEHGGLAALLSGASLLLLAAFAPYTLLRLVPFVEAGAANHLEGVASSLPGRATSAARTPGGVVDDLLGRSSDFAPAGGAGAGGTDARTTGGANRLAANPGGLHIADPTTFDATRAGGASSASSAGGGTATAEAGAGLGTAVAAPAALLVVGQGLASAAKDRAAGAVDGLRSGAGADDGD